MATALFEDLTQKLPRVLRPRFELMLFENGVLIPTEFDLEPGTRSISYEVYDYTGNAEFTSDSDESVPIVDVTGSLDRYPVYMVSCGIPISMDLAMAYNAQNRIASKDILEQRMTGARMVINQRINIATALGRSGLNFDGFVTNPSVTVEDSSFDINTATYDQARNFFVSIIEGLTRNLVTSYPTDMVVPPIYYEKMMGLASANDKVLVTHIKELYPRLNIHRANEVRADRVDSAITRPGGQVGKDRIIIYPREDRVLHRHMEEAIAKLAPEDFSRVADVGGVLSKIYFMYACVTPAIIDYPNDIKYHDVVAAA